MVKDKMRLLSTSCWCQGARMKALPSGVMQLLLLLAVMLSCQGCPDKCECSLQTVRCQNKDLDAIPPSIPANCKILSITGNNISGINEDSFPSQLELLTYLDLSDNEIEAVEEMVFHNLPNLVQLDLSNNYIQTFSMKAFPDENKLQLLNLSRSIHNYSSVIGLLNGNLRQLTVLDLSDNDFVLLPDDFFKNLPNLVNLSLQNSSIVSIPNGLTKVPRLQDLDLRHNSLRSLPYTIMTEFSLKSDLYIRLNGNPWRCDCSIEDMLVWLKNSTLVTDMKNLTCADPEHLKRRPLVQLEQTQLKCSGNMEGVLETSYVFLGLVLALIGVIFLLVLYLNRKGIKRWMYNIRDACRDHMEGYHYRYEINSDPRLANLSINSDV
ncbi:trophoblast glycoprotein b [Corythoichthys intestinalis]|uniref:trophoblast glycoprotein b n=1 Tax=Corythoichthys intestinalis TaxID=161448 RepID=UPI0025A543A7|nr:trophoblast glycoprotein b [Corythoichthys intestinalis]XP_061790002.1 trophoblast glycoprotein-like [Nerophis lumbriciformis]